MSLGSREGSQPRDDRNSDAGGSGGGVTGNAPAEAPAASPTATTTIAAAAAAAVTNPSPRSGNGDDAFANLDPALHPETLNSVAAESQQNPLTSFAQHVLDGRENELLGFESEEQVLLAMGETRLDTLLEAAHKTERERQGLDGDGHHNEYQFSNEAAPAQQTEEAAPEAPAEQHEALPPPPPPLNNGRHVGRNKRRREGDELVVGPVENGEPIDPIKMKKDSHKEVERRRRENINDGINEIARYIPGGMEKIGKGMLLRRAAEHLGELTAKVARFDEELANRESEKREVEDQLAHTEARYQEERARSMRFETSWREAEDRAANQQFELERIKAELEEAKKTLAAK